MDANNISDKTSDEIPKGELFEWLHKTELPRAMAFVSPGTTFFDPIYYYNNNYTCIVAVDGPGGQKTYCGHRDPSYKMQVEHLITVHKLVRDRSQAKPPSHRLGEAGVIELDNTDDEAEPPTKRVCTGIESNFIQAHYLQCLDHTFFDWGYDWHFDVTAPDIRFMLNKRARRERPVPPRIPENALEHFYKGELGMK